MNRAQLHLTASADHTGLWHVFQVDTKDGLYGYAGPFPTQQAADAFVHQHPYAWQEPGPTARPRRPTVREEVGSRY